MQKFIRQILPGNKVIWISYSALGLLSILFLFSASSTLVASSGSVSAPIKRHITFLLVGLVSTICLQKMSTKFIRLFIGKLLLYFSWVLLFLAMFIGESKGGATRSVFGIQPSELARLALIVTSASFISQAVKPQFLKKNFNYFVAEFLITLGLVLPSNLSTTLLLGFTIFMMLIIGKIPWKYILRLFLICVTLFVVFLSVSLMVIKIYPDSSEAPSWSRAFRRVETWQARVDNYVTSVDRKMADVDNVNPYAISDEKGVNNRQSVYSLIAVSRGGIYGVGLGQSNQKNYLPEAYSDFIFAIICEETGLFGIAILFSFYVVLFGAVVRVIFQSKNFFHILICSGCMVIMITQITIHCFVCMNLFPLTGQPLPLISNGGSSILVNSIYIGFFIYASRDWKYVKQSKEKDTDDESANKPTNERSNEAVKDTVAETDSAFGADRQFGTKEKEESENGDDITIEIE